MHTRRLFMKNGMGGLGLLTLPSLLSSQLAEVRKKIVVAGGHPDDPETGCAGTILQLVKAGHEVTIIYLTNGDRGIEGKGLAESSDIRRKEAIAACKILGAKPVFANQVDGDSVMNNPELLRFEKLLFSENPDIVFVHWPIDSHKDHQVASLLTIQAWNHTQRPFTLYFYEVCTGVQTFGFHPTDYVDISATRQSKLEVLVCHKSQNIVENGKYTPAFYDCGHPSMEDFRGKELGVKAAEAFIRMNGRGFGALEF